MDKKIYTCGAGRFTGYETERCVHVQGIRYADAKRYQAPVPYIYPIGIHACGHPAPFAAQQDTGLERRLFGTEFGSVPKVENPQFLSVTMPKNSEGPLPVMVWYHGGGFHNGGCDSPIYNYEYLASEQNLILVGINYRLGILGFSVDEYGRPGHPGLLDAIEGLRWVKRNIAAFGGDLDNITIFGQSAGAELCRCILLSEGTGDLFRRAILQSDPIGTMSGREAMEKEILDGVREIPPYCPASLILETQHKIAKGIRENGLPKFLIFSPHFGVKPLPELSGIEARLSEAAKTHELLIGCTTREVSVYGAKLKPYVLLDEWRLTRGVTEDMTKKLGGKIFNEPCAAFARLYEACGGKTWEYVFSWEDERRSVAAGHMMDLLPLFGADTAEGEVVSLGFTAQEILETGRPMRDLWGMFAREGILPDHVTNDLLDIHAVHGHEEQVSEESALSLSKETEITDNDSD